jgi:alpha-L-fucosidase
MKLTLAATVYIFAVSSLPIPSAEQLAWQADEIGVIIHFNMATMVGSQGCRSSAPDISNFKPAKLDTDQWVEAMTNLGAKYAVYVAKHSCGFAAWPTNISFPFLPGGKYAYSVTNAPIKTDVAGSFAASCRKKSIKPGFYYSLGKNSYTKSSLKLPPDQFNQVVLAQVEELWSWYGQLGEIWFDGGYAPDIKTNLSELINKLQPNAAVFNGFGVANSPLRWIGTEAGTAPYPNWSTNDGRTPGGGDPAGADFVPGEVDTTLQENDQVSAVMP